MTIDALLHILTAALLGGIIGLEREYRAKEAGFRTHFLVALGAALFMILSAHGFEGVLTTENHRLDVSRIAAQVVSGIGFIGAGTIIIQRHAVRGLTTAAGLWVTAAIGMAAGAGLYVLASATTVLTLLGLEALNVGLRRIGRRSIDLTLAARHPDQVARAVQQLRQQGIAVVGLSLQKSDAPATAPGGPGCTAKLQLRLRSDRYHEQPELLLGLLSEVDVVSLE